jgi:hypothetical protein
MAHPIVHPAVERLHIHLAVCRARRAGLCCGTCCELAARAANGWGICPCGNDDYLIGGLCEPCRVAEAA